MNTHKKETKPKPTGPSPPVRTAHMSVHITGHNCGNCGSDNHPSYLPDNHHSSDSVH